MTCCTRAKLSNILYEFELVEYKIPIKNRPIYDLFTKNTR